MVEPLRCEGLATRGGGGWVVRAVVAIGVVRAGGGGTYSFIAGGGMYSFLGGGGGRGM